MLVGDFQLWMDISATQEWTALFLWNASIHILFPLLFLHIGWFFRWVLSVLNIGIARVGKIYEIGSTGISTLGGHSEKRTQCLNRFAAEFGRMPLVPTSMKAVDSRRMWFWWWCSFTFFYKTLNFHLNQLSHFFFFFGPLAFELYKLVCFPNFCILKIGANSFTCSWNVTCINVTM